MKNISDTIEEHAQESLEERIAQTGWVARQALKIQVALENDRNGMRYDGKNILKKTYYRGIHLINTIPAGKKTFDTLYSYRIIATLTGYDQELYCKIKGNGLTPKKLTIINATIVTGIIAGMNYTIAHHIGEIPDNHFTTTIATFVGEQYFSLEFKLQIAWSVIRTAYALKTKNGLEPIGLEALGMNSFTYVKRLRAWARRQGEISSTNTYGHPPHLS